MLVLLLNDFNVLLTILISTGSLLIFFLTNQLVGKIVAYKRYL